MLTPNQQGYNIQAASAKFPAANIIRYKTTDGLPLPDSNSYVNNNTLLHNIYQNGEGRLVYAKAVTNIANNAFNNSAGKKLTWMHLPDDVVLIGNYAFYYANHLASLEMPDSVSSIDSDAFYGCSSLALTKFPSAITFIGNLAFADCAEITATELPIGLTEIRKSAFAGCKKLAVSEIHDGVKYIRLLAFNLCQKLAITELPKGVTTIENQAFRECTLITDLKILRTENKINGGQSMFENIHPTIRVPNALLAEYQADANWNVYNLVGYDPE